MIGNFLFSKGFFPRKIHEICYVIATQHSKPPKRMTERDQAWLQKWFIHRKGSLSFRKYCEREELWVSLSGKSQGISKLNCTPSLGSRSNSSTKPSCARWIHGCLLLPFLALPWVYIYENPYDVMRITDDVTTGFILPYLVQTREIQESVVPQFLRPVVVCCGKRHNCKYSPESLYKLIEIGLSVELAVTTSMPFPFNHCYKKSHHILFSGKGKISSHSNLELPVKIWC